MNTFPIYPTTYLTHKMFFNMEDVLIEWYKKQFIEKHVDLTKEGIPVDAYYVLDHIYGFSRRWSIFKKLKIVAFQTKGSRKLSFELSYTDSTPSSKREYELYEWQMQYLKLATM